MIVSVSSVGRFHAFELAEQMRQRGHLGRLYTANPRFRINRQLRPSTSTFPWIFTGGFLAERWGFERLGARLNGLAIESFDHWVTRRVTPSDVFHHLSSFGLYSARQSRIMGARIVCDRASSHIRYQDQVLREEFARNKIAYGGISQRLVEREVQEYEQADLITVPSTFAYRSFIEKGVAQSKVRVLRLAVDLSLFHPCKKEDDRFRVIYMGSYSVRKGLTYLFDAIRPLSLQKRAELWLVSGSRLLETRDTLSRNADLFVDKGWLPRERLSWTLSQASVLVQPSVEEGLSAVTMQAMSCGVPVIATTNTGAEDLVTGGVEGFIVPIRDPNAIRTKIEWMLDNPAKRDEMAQAALRRVKSLGGWDEYGSQAVTLYSELLNSSKAAANV